MEILNHFSPLVAVFLICALIVHHKGAAYLNKRCKIVNNSVAYLIKALSLVANFILKRALINERCSCFNLAPLSVLSDVIK